MKHESYTRGILYPFLIYADWVRFGASFVYISLKNVMYADHGVNTECCGMPRLDFAEDMMLRNDTNWTLSIRLVALAILTNDGVYADIRGVTTEVAELSRCKRKRYGAYGNARCYEGSRFRILLIEPARNTAMDLLWNTMYTRCSCWLDKVCYCTKEKEKSKYNTMRIQEERRQEERKEYGSDIGCWEGQCMDSTRNSWMH